MNTDFCACFPLISHKSSQRLFQIKLNHQTVYKAIKTILHTDASVLMSKYYLTFILSENETVTFFEGSSSVRSFT